MKYRAFFLDPTIPPEGIDFRSYLLHKFGQQARVDALFASSHQLGADAGLVFRMDLIRKAPNTMLAHCLVALTPEAGQEALIEDLYSALFERGEDIGDLNTLVELGGRHGMDPAFLRKELESGSMRARVEADVAQAQALGINAVPFFVIDDRYGFSGAQPPEVILRILQQVISEGEGRQP